MTETENYLIEKVRDLTTRVFRLESILMHVPAPPDFSKEDALVRSTASQVQDALHHLPPPEHKP